MINLNQTYINIKSNKSSENLGARKFIASVLMVASFATTSLQAGFVLNANASNNPISSPISTQPSPTATPTPTPTTVVCSNGHIANIVNGVVVCVGQSQTQNQGSTSSSSSVTVNPITSPEVTPTPTPAPITSPVLPSPTPTPAPVTSPVVTPTPTATPVATPTPVPSPFVKITYPNGGEIFNVGQFVKVQWEQKNVDQCVVSYVNDSNVYGSHFFPINPINNYFNWIVDVSGLAQGSSAQIKMDISCYDAFSNGASDRSDNYFTVNRPYPSVIPSVSPSATPSAQPSSTPIASTSPLANNGGNSSNNNGGGSSNSGSNSAPSCNNEAPKAPYMVSAITTGKNEVTLNWSKPVGNVTHYSVAYGVVKNKPMFGAANVGNVTSFRVNGLSGGGTYFFTVKAVNDCTPSAASNEIGVKVAGISINTPAQGFKPGVLGKTATVNLQINKPAIATTPAVVNQVVNTNQNNTGLFGKIINFFKGLFN